MTNKKKISLILLSFIMIIAVSYKFNGTVQAENQDTSTDEFFTVMDRDGNTKNIPYNNEEEPVAVNAEVETYQVVKKIGDYTDVIGDYETYEEAAEAMENSKRQRGVGDVMVMANNAVRTVDYGVVRLRNKVIDYTEVDSGRSGYFHGGTAADAAYISTSSNGQNIRLKVAGIMMDVPVSDVLSIEPYTDATWCSSYSIYNGILYHDTMYWNGNSYNQFSSVRVGYKLGYTQTGVDYFSYDGHYFYTSFQTMINDYRNGNYNNAINAGNPYYNYYQYLSHRTTTTFSASTMNNFLAKSINGRASALTSQAQAFINSQNTYTSNAGLMLGVSINESGWGMSTYALTRNNLFGHQAYDSDPDQATVYGSAEESVNNHASSYVNGYLNAIDSRYRGPHLGDKRSGMNVKYASDATWGEKAASHMYVLSASDNSDYGRYAIGIINTGEQWFYKEANPSSKQIYSSATTDGAGYDSVYDYPVTILSKVTGTDGQLWYKIQSDTALTADRNQISPSSIYNASRDYVYIPASSVQTLIGTVPGEDGGYIAGDVDGNGKVESYDYFLVKNHVTGKNGFNLSGAGLKAADFDSNGVVESYDYFLIKSHVRGQ